MSNSRPRVLWLSHFMFYPPTTGGRIRSYNLFRELSKQFELDLLILDTRHPRDGEIDHDSESAELRQYADQVHIVSLGGNRTLLGKAFWFISSFFSSLPVTTTMLFRRRAMLEMRELLASHGYDAIYFDTVDLWLYSKAIVDTPIIQNHQNVESALLARAAARKHFLLRWYFRLQAARVKRLEEAVCPQVARNIVVSYLDKKQFMSFCDGQFSVVANGVDTANIEPVEARRDREAKHLIWAGGMHWFPNRDAIEYFAREIWPQIADKNDSLRAIIVGSHPPSILQQLASPARLEVTGFVDTVQPYLERADIYVVPIRVGGGTRLKVLEAFAAGIPVVSTSIGAEGIEAVDGQHILIRDDPSDFAYAVLELYNNRELRNTLAANARSLVEKRYAWNQIGADFRGVVDEVLLEARYQKRTGARGSRSL